MYKLIAITPYGVSDKNKKKLEGLINKEAVARRLVELDEKSIKKMVDDTVEVYSGVTIIEENSMSKVKIAIDKKLLRYERNVTVGHVYKDDKYLEKF